MPRHRGDQSNNSAPYSGAAYVFAGLTPVIPRLAFLPSANSITLSWPTNALGFVLQSATSLTNGGNWQNSSLTPIVTNGQNVVTMNPTSPAAFFRLHQP